MPPVTKSLIAVDGHRAYGYLSSFAEQLVMSRAVNMSSITYPVKQIVFDNPYSGGGSHTDVLEGMEIVVYNQNTTTVKGRLRVAPGAATSTIIQVNEFARGTLDLADDDRFEVLRSWRIRPRLVEASSSFRRDSRVTYTNQNSVVQPICNSGGLWVGWKANANAIPFAGGSSRTVDPDSSGAVTHSWTFPSGTPSSSTAAAPTVDYSTAPAGTYTVTHVVTDTSNSASATQYVPVRLHDANDPPMRCAAQLTGARDGGWRATFTVYEDTAAKIAQLPDGALIAFWLDEYYGSTFASYGNVIAGRSHIKFVGYLDADSLEWDYENQTLTFEAVSPIDVLRQIASSSQVVENFASPTTWLQFDRPSVHRVIWYILRWCSTALLTHDLLLAQPDYVFPAFYVQESDFYSQLLELADALDCEFTSDRLGRLHSNRPYSLQTPAEQTASGTTLTLERADIRLLRVERSHRTSVGLLEARGFTSSSAAVVAIYSRAPGDAPGEAAGRTIFERKIAASQSELNARAGRAFARANSTLNGVLVPPNIEVETTTGGYDIFDPAYAEAVALTLPENKRGLTYTGHVCELREVTADYRPEAGTPDIRLSLASVTGGVPGTTYIPPIVTTDLPPIDRTLPPIPPINPFDLPGAPRGDGTGAIAAFARATTLMAITNNWSSAYPNWTLVDLSLLTGFGGGTLVDFAVDPFSPLYLGTGSTVNGWILLTGHVQRISDIFGTPTLSTAHALTFTTPSANINFERGVQNWGIVVQHKNTPGGGTAAAYTTDGVTWTNVLIDSNYESNYVLNGDSWQPGLQVSPHTAGRAYTTAMLGTGVGGDGFTGRVTTNFGASWSTLSSATCKIDGTLFNAGAVVVPYQDTSMTTAYYGRRPIVSGQVTPQLIRARGSTATNISPVSSGNQYGVPWRPFGGSNRAVAVADTDRNTVLLCGMHNSTVPVATHGVFLSRTAGDSWSELISPSTTMPYRAAYISGGSANTFYLLGTNGAIAFVNDGSTVQDKQGDLSISATLIALCGG